MTVHSVFRHVVNLESPHLFFSILDQSKPMEPFSVKVNSLPSFQIGDIVVIENNTLKKGKWEINLLEEKQFDPYVRLNPKEIDITNPQKHLNEISFAIMNKNNGVGIASLVFEQDLDSEKEFIKNDYRGYVDAIKNSNTSSMIYYAKRICGFGHGLTPSMDDFLCGYMLVAFYLNRYFHIEYIVKNSVLYKELEGITNQISLHMLWASSEGLCNEYIQKFLICFITGNDISEAIERVLSIGASSGSDFLCGIYVAFKHILRPVLNH